ncbi:MAG: hypothetical protein MJK10_05485 [Pseudomonadales bacterium]|nr:hypothetical protein [Pseudomonadales bacterium]NRA15395.1 hypothetical protein [Oceanospirillaceae bacterium]
MKVLISDISFDFLRIFRFQRVTFFTRVKKVTKESTPKIAENSSADCQVTGRSSAASMPHSLYTTSCCSASVI